MITTLWYLATASLVSVLAGWGHYLATIPRNTVPKTPIIMISTQILGILLATASFYFAQGNSSVPTGIWVLSGLALFMALFFFVIYANRRTPVGNLQVAVGDRMLPFETLDSSGTKVNTDSWRGQRVLLKFFRGHW